MAARTPAKKAPRKVAPRKIDDGIPSITTVGTRKITAEDKKPFRVDKDVFQLIRPKASMLAQAGLLLDPTRPWNEMENNRVLLQYTSVMTAYVEQQLPDPKTGRPRGQELLLQRLNSPGDDLDLTHLLPLLEQIMTGWMSSEDRPTGSPRESSKPRQVSELEGSADSTP